MVSSNDYIGLSKKRAQDLAEKHNMIFRLIRIDEERFHDYPEDKREDRICVEIDNAVITKVVFQ